MKYQETVSDKEYGPWMRLAMAFVPAVILMGGMIMVVAMTLAMIM